MNNMNFRLRNQKKQQDRMIYDKKLTLQKVTKYSYQGATINKINSVEEYPALINRNRLTADYDEKILSIEYEYGMSVGDVFTWSQNDTKWLIYLQDLTELAYFRGNIRKCTHLIQWYDTNGIECCAYCSIIGPKQNKIDSLLKEYFIMDVPNYTISLLLPKNNDTINHFQRYTKFYLRDINKNNNTPTCWRVEAVDSVTLPGVLEVYAKEYYINDDTDIVTTDNNQIEYIPNGKPEIVDDNGIVGEAIIKSNFSYSYSTDKIDQVEWQIESQNVEIINKEEKNNQVFVTIRWKQKYGGTFVIKYGDKERKITAVSIFE